MPETSRKLLVVDDEPAQLEALCESLTAAGYHVRGCANAAAALAALETENFDVLLTDMNMPGMDGIELTRAALRINSILSCVVMTGAGSIETAVESMRSGAVDFIQKPFKLRTAVPVIDRALEHRGLVRANRDLQAHVVQQRDRLMQINRDLEGFSATVSHDLRAPVHVIAGFANVLQRSHAHLLDERGRHYLERISAAAGNMDTLIHGMLRLATLARQPLEVAPVALGPLVQSVVDDLIDADVAGARQIIVGPLPELSCDQALIRQVFHNLLSNACKFTAKVAEPRIELGTRNDGEAWTFFVRDNGTGLDMAHAAGLFQPFRRMHSSSEFPGVGVGLSIVQRVIERHGGGIRVESTPGEGATFIFTLPAQPAV